MDGNISFKPFPESFKAFTDVYCNKNMELKLEEQEYDTTKDGIICLPSHIDNIKLDELPTQLEQRIENSVKSYHCNESNKYFAHKRHLVRHHKTHWVKTI